jgi:hypothetical protein
MALEKFIRGKDKILIGPQVIVFHLRIHSSKPHEQSLELSKLYKSLCRPAVIGVVLVILISRSVVVSFGRHIIPLDVEPGGIEVLAVFPQFLRGVYDLVGKITIDDVANQGLTVGHLIWRGLLRWSGGKGGVGGGVDVEDEVGHGGVSGEIGFIEICFEDVVEEVECDCGRAAVVPEWVETRFVLGEFG